MPESGDSLLATVAVRLQERTSELVELQLRALRRLVAYDRVPTDDLRRSCARNVARVVAALEQRHQLPPEIEEDERASGRRRALQGVPTDDVVEAYRLVLGILRDVFIQEAVRVEADPREVLAGTVRLWELTDRYSNILVAARQQVEIEAARRDEQHRMAFLQRLLTGVDPAELVAGGAVHGMLPGERYWVIRARQDDRGTQRLSRHLDGPHPESGFRPLVAPFDDDVVCISVARPAPLPGSVIAVAGPTSVAAVPQAFAEASRVLQVALRYRRAGVVDSSTLSVRVAVEQQPEIGEQLFRRYIGPFIGPRGRNEELLRTVQCYLEHRRSVADTAVELSVHDNTVRYRLDRYRGLVGADLADTDVLVELWWAFEHHRIRGVNPVT
ncbi:MAG TPA: helix-turn-helix domain-containing protein [Pseudonocardia sp.]|jgi:putative transposase